jgi:hypothetical protein
MTDGLRNHAQDSSLRSQPGLGGVLAAPSVASRSHARPHSTSLTDMTDTGWRAREWWNGRHDGLRSHWPRGRAGSNPASRTSLPGDIALAWYVEEAA